MAQGIAVTIRLGPSTLKAIDAEAENEFSSRAAIAASRLDTVYASGAPDPLPKSARALAGERKIEIEKELMELKLAKERGDVILVATARAFIQKDYGVIRSRLLNIPQAMPGATPEQVADLKKIVQDVMTYLSGEQQDSWDDIPR